MAQTPPKISDSEWRIMKLLWKKSPQTAREIIDGLRDIVDWAPKTTKTLLNRLVNKGALNFKKEGRIYHYYPKLSEALCKKHESRHFLNRVFDGALTPMITTFIQEGKLTQQDIVDLTQILEQEQGEHNG